MTEQTTDIYTQQAETPPPIAEITDLRGPEIGIAGALLVDSAMKSKSLEALRYGVMGNDAAVVEIGTSADKQHMIDILTEPGQHNRDELLASVAVNYSGKVYGDAQWLRSIPEWGNSPEVVTEYGKFIDAYPSLGQLCLDPGVMTHLPELARLLSTGEITASNYVDVRQQLKEKLGYETVWQGITLTDEELARAQTDGLESSLSRVVRSYESPLERFEAVALSSQPSATIDKHFHGEHRASPFLSVTKHPDVAIAVGRHYGKTTPGKKFCLFELSVPVIDIVSYKDHAIKTPTVLHSMQRQNPDYSLSVSVDGVQSTYLFDSGVESFIFWKIDPREIVSVTQPVISESTWNNRTTGPMRT